MSENEKNSSSELIDQELKNVSGGIIHPVFMWQCDDCKKYLGKYYDDNTCNSCGSKNLHYVRIM